MGPSSGAAGQPAPDDEDSCSTTEYDPPRVIDIGHVRELTKGSAATGNADTNSQYYW